jgi:hypothetical protein
MRLLDPALIGGVLGVLIGIVCLSALWRTGESLARTRSELRTAVDRNQAACLEQIGQVGRAVEFLELSGQSTGDAIGRAMNRSLRSQAMNLLRSGMLPDTVASTLGVAKREVRLIAGVSGVLARNEYDIQ